MFKKKSSVQINIEGRAEKNLEIPTFLVKYWKQIGISASLSILILTGSIAYIASKKNTTDKISSQYEQTLDKINEQNEKLALSKEEVEQDVLEAKKTFNQIDSTLDAINKKMKKRGLKTISLPNTGGPVETNPDNIELLKDYYSETLKDLDTKLSNIPLGVPHTGKVTSKFGYRANPFTRRGREMHSGIDFKGNTGDAIRATANGVVTFAGYDGQYGRVVKIQHKNGYETRYAHLSKTEVKSGQKVEAGSMIGKLGNTGRSTGPHLHYEILKNDKKINPEKYFSL